MTRRTLVTILLTLYLLGNAGITAWALYSRFESTNKRRAVQIDFNARLATIDTRDCQEIEKLKKAQRDIAIDNFKHLDANGKLLGIKITPALRVAARDAKFATLKRYHPEVCPRKVHIGGTQ